MASLKLKNTEQTEFTVTHEDGIGSITVTSELLNALNTENIKNIANGTIPASDPLIAGIIWNNNGILSISNG